MARFIGIEHRRKKTVDGDARPTRVYIIDQGASTGYELETETGEMDFMLGRFPVKYRLVTSEDDLSTFQAHHIKWRTLKSGQETDQVPEGQTEVEDDTGNVAEKVPAEFDGLKPDDTVGMILGGSGDRLAFALSRRGEEVGAQVFRLPPFVLKDQCDKLGKSKDNNAQLLAELVRDNREIFHLTTKRDRQLIHLAETYRAFMEAMRTRMGCAQRLLQHTVGITFCSEDGKYPEGTIEALFDQEKANDQVLQALSAQEAKWSRKLTKALNDLPIYQQLFEQVEGMGPRIAARLIVAIRDIRRFSTPAKLKAYLGAHVMKGGRFGDLPLGKQFPRRRFGEVANWQADGRQALFLLTDQFNRRPKSPWGIKLREIKARLRAKHPEPVQMEFGRKLYTDGHILRMARQIAANKFVVWLWKNWTRWEQNQVQTKTVVVEG